MNAVLELLRCANAGEKGWKVEPPHRFSRQCACTVAATCASHDQQQADLSSTFVSALASRRLCVSLSLLTHCFHKVKAILSGEFCRPRSGVHFKPHAQSCIKHCACYARHDKQHTLQLAQRDAITFQKGNATLSRTVLSLLP
eukprot:3864620-Amphidinium_carterae.1